MPGCDSNSQGLGLDNSGARQEDFALGFQLPDYQITRLLNFSATPTLIVPQPSTEFWSSPA
jgi:hypothetical protein